MYLMFKHGAIVLAATGCADSRRQRRRVRVRVRRHQQTSEAEPLAFDFYVLLNGS